MNERITEPRACRELNKAVGQPFILSFTSETLAAAFTGAQARGSWHRRGPGAEFGKGRGSGVLSGTQRQPRQLEGPGGPAGCLDPATPAASPCPHVTCK